METGTFGMAPKNTAHFAWSKTETILQVHGVGPFTSTVVEPGYELIDKGIFALTSLLLPGRPTSSSPPDCFVLRINAKVSRDAGEGSVVGARCSPTNQITQDWVQSPNGERFWANASAIEATMTFSIQSQGFTERLPDREPPSNANGRACHEVERVRSQVHSGSGNLVRLPPSTGRGPGQNAGVPPSSPIINTVPRNDRRGLAQGRQKVAPVQGPEQAAWVASQIEQGTL
jgi:hypothetical protein